MKIVFMGTPRAAAVGLERLIRDGHEIVAVYTQPDRPSGRGNKITFSPVKESALTHDLSIFQPARIKSAETQDQFRSHKADVVVVVAFGRILPEGFLNAYPRGALNVHFSLLPKYRGAAPVNWAVVNGETETGVAIIRMDAGLDTGDILLQESTPIATEETAVDLMDRLSLLGSDLISRTLEDIDSLSPKPQNEDEATFAPILKKADGFIDWSRSAVDIERRVRGFQPFPTSYTFYRSVRMTIWRATVNDVEFRSNVSAGSIMQATGDMLDVACGEGSVLSITDIQPEGKRRMAVREFLNGAHLKVGERFGRDVYNSEAGVGS